MRTTLWAVASIIAIIAVIAATIVLVGAYSLHRRRTR